MTDPIPREDLLEELRRLADALGSTPRQCDVEEHGKYSKNTYHRRFGSYRDACREAGLQPNGRWYDNQATAQELLSS